MKNMKEEDMYLIVEEYLKNKLKNIGFELNIFSGNASSVDLSLPLFGSYIKPDVYAIGEDKNGIFRIIMAEGKLTYKGRDLDGVIWQGISDQRFSHFVYIFFPKEELESNIEAKKFIKKECRKYGLGLLSVDIKTNDSTEELSPQMSPFNLNEESIRDFEKNIILARDKIRMNFGKNKEIEYVHLTTMRDLAILLSQKKQWKEKDLFKSKGAIDNLLEEYQKIDGSGGKSSLRKYDAKVWKAIIDGDINKFKEIMKRNLRTLLFFDIIAIRNDIIEVKPLCKIMASLDKANQYKSKCDENLKQFLTYVLLTNEETKKLVDAIVNILRGHSPIPVWAKRGYCPQSVKCKEKCGFKGDWTPEGQPFPEFLEYDPKTKKHTCKIDGKSFEFDKCTVTSILHCSYKLNLPERIKILISESTLINQRGRTHEWSLAI